MNWRVKMNKEATGKIGGGRWGQRTRFILTRNLDCKWSGWDKLERKEHVYQQKRGRVWIRTGNQRPAWQRAQTQHQYQPALTELCHLRYLNKRSQTELWIFSADIGLAFCLGLTLSKVPTQRFNGIGIQCLLLNGLYSCMHGDFWLVSAPLLYATSLEEVPAVPSVPGAPASISYPMSSIPSSTL